MRTVGSIFILLVQFAYKGNFFWLNVVGDDFSDLLLFIKNGNTTVISHCRHNQLRDFLKRQLMIQRGNQFLTDCVE